MPTHVGLVVLDGATDSGLSVALDVFRTANSLARRAGRPAPFGIDVLTATGGPVRVASGLTTTAHGDFRKLDGYQVVLAPGCWVETDQDVTDLLARPEAATAVAALRGAVDRGTLVGASCTGTFLLAATGRLDHRHATTTWWLAAGFRRRFASVRLDVSRSLTVDNGLLCAGSVFAMADLALAIVSQFAGPSLARECTQVLLLDEHPSQAPYMALRHLVTNEPVVRSAETWVRGHLPDSFSIGELAHAIGTSPRTLARRIDAALGLSPLTFINGIRLEAATHLIETSTLPLSEVARRVGYRDAGTLRRLVRRTVGHTPGQLRRH